MRKIHNRNRAGYFCATPIGNNNNNNFSKSSRKSGRYFFFLSLFLLGASPKLCRLMRFLCTQYGSDRLSACACIQSPFAYNRPRIPTEIAQMPHGVSEAHKTHMRSQKHARTSLNTIISSLRLLRVFLSMSGLEEIPIERFLAAQYRKKNVCVLLVPSPFQP